MASTRFRMIGVALFVVALSALEATKRDVDNKEGRLTLQSKLIRDLTAQIQVVNGTIADKDVRLALQSKRIGNLTAQYHDVNRIVDVFKGKMRSCKDWFAVDRRSGVRPIYASGQYMAVYCDQDTYPGGWAVFQRRKDASVDFYRGWTEYRNGFGDPEGNFWLGLDKLHSLSTSQKSEMRVDLHRWERPYRSVPKVYAIYNNFYVDDASQNFTLHLDKMTRYNTAGDSLFLHNGMQFTTKDRDNDKDIGANCAQGYHGAWWYIDCLRSNLNGIYKPNSSAPDKDGIWWKTSDDSHYSFKFSEMKVRPM